MELRLSKQLSLVTTWALPVWSAGPAAGDDVFARAAAAGYEGVQVFLPEQASAARAAGLEASAISPARTAAEADGLCAMWAEGEASSLTLHLGTGFETADEAEALVTDTLACADRHGVPVLVETHRGTLFQDPARALALVDRFPELRFTADLSHWYTGVELVYGDLDAKLAALQPVFDRCHMVHGRISDPGCIQVAVRPDDDATYVDHFRRMWTAVIEGCGAGGELDVLPFVVELLPAAAFYARTIDRGAGPEEEADRWTQAELLWDFFAGLGSPA